MLVLLLKGKWQIIDLVHNQEGAFHDSHDFIDAVEIN